MSSKLTIELKNNNNNNDNDSNRSDSPMDSPASSSPAATKELNLKGAEVLQVKIPTYSSLTNSGIPATELPSPHRFSQEDHCIFLPFQKSEILQLSLDIGGTLVKMVYFESDVDHRRTHKKSSKDKNKEEIEKSKKQQQQQNRETSSNETAAMEEEDEEVADIVTATTTTTTTTTEEDNENNNNNKNTNDSNDSSSSTTTTTTTTKYIAGDGIPTDFDPIASTKGGKFALPPVTDRTTTTTSFVSLNKLGGGRLCFARFQSACIEDCISFIKALEQRRSRPSSINATGGGAYKFEKLFKDELGVSLNKIDEMQSLIIGLTFLLKHIPNESFTYTKYQEKEFQPSNPSDLYPFLLVNIGSGVSILKVTGDNEFERVSGSSLGGGTFWGLAHLLTKSDSFDEVLSMCLKGDNSKVDMLVGDIYGSDYSKVGLPANTIASSVGKTIRKGQDGKTQDFKSEDIARSLLFMISNNIGQIAYLNALRFGIKRIYFGGFFIRDHPITMGCISYAINFWSSGKMNALFLKHEGYLGAIGCLISQMAIVK